MSECIALIHNSQVIIEQVGDAFKRIYPEAETINIMDESLLRDIKLKGGIDHFGFRRICRYALCAEDLGANAVLMTCSSLCEAVYAAKPMIKIPAFAINEPMSIAAVSLGENIGVIGTLKSVLVPTAKLILKHSKESGKTINLKKVLCGDAFDALMSGDKELHDQMILREIENISADVDVIVFAQGSMSRLLQKAQKLVNIPILECIDSGVRQVKSYFETSGYE